MDLERLSVRLRPRKPWEAVDLGFTMVRAWRGILYPPWLALTVPTAVALIWTLGFWGLLIFWWLLPLFEAVVLRPLSRAVFGEQPTAGETLRAAPGEMKRAWREVALRRFHPARSFALPIGQLENLKGADRRLRRSVLSRAIEVHGGVTLVFIFFELLLIVAFFTLVVMMTPSWLGIDWDLASTRFFDGLSAPWAYNAVWTLAALVKIAIGPFYVAAGFALYLDRRTALEGWDLEIAFRRMAQRLHRLDAGRQEKSARIAARAGRAALWVGVLTAALLAGVVGFGAEPARAQPAQVEASGGVDSAPEPPPAVWDGEEGTDPRVVAREITAQAEYGGAVKVERWQLRQELKKWLEGRGRDEPEPASKPHPILLGIAWLVMKVSEIFLWLVVGLVLLGLVVVAIRKWPDLSGRKEDKAEHVPEMLFGLDLRAESLPTDVAAEAERLWRGGDVAGALSLLYRGALKRLADEGVMLAESFTEDDCLRAARGSLEPMRTGFFAELTRAWQRVAYGHKLPSGDENGERWWSGWRRHFGPGSQPHGQVTTS